MAPQSNENKPTYQKDEKVLCFHGELLYDAKITDVERTDPKETKSPYHYKVHYKGWKNTWDDWVPQDRLRKNTEENRELAANLRQQAALKAAPKLTGKTRRGQGSEIGSGRGSEERTSSVPATGGRGSKRARDNDLEKVGGDFPSHKRTRVNDSRDDSRDDDEPHFDMMSWVIGLPKNKSLLKNFPKDIPPPNLDIKDPLDAESIASVASQFGDLDDDDNDKDNDHMDQPTTVHDQREAEPSKSEEQRRNDRVDLRQFVYVPRKAAVKATTALANTKWKQPSAAASSAKKTTKKKKPPKSNGAATKEQPVPASSSTHDLSAGLSDNPLSTSETVKLHTKDAKVVRGKRSANVGKQSDATQERSEASRARGCNRSKAHDRSNRTATPSSVSVRNHDFTPVSDLEDEEISAAENEKNEDLVTSVRRTVETRAAVPNAKSTSTSKPILKKSNESRLAQQTTPSSSRLSKSPRKLRSNTTTKATPSRKLRNSKDTMASYPQQPLRPWKIKDTTNYTSADIDRLLADPAPQDEPEFFSLASWENRKIFHAPLISGTTSLEQTAIDEELRDARKDGRQYKLRHLGPRQRLPQQYEELASDIDSDGEDNGAAPAGGVPGEPFEVDPPGSNTPFDALKFPYRLIDRINRDGDKFPPGWTEENLKCIPNHCVVWIREELLAKMPYSVLKDRPDWVLKEVPDNALFWDQYERENEVEIINAFVARAARRYNDDNHALLELASAATDRASEAAAQASRSIGSAAPSDFRVEGCQKCAKYGVKCDGVKPICHYCKQEGLECDFTFPKVEESYMRRGSVYDRQQEFANLGAHNLEFALRARVPAPRDITGLDVLALAAEVVESGTANRVQDNLAGHIQDPGRGIGSRSDLHRGQHPMYQLARTAHFPICDFDLDQGTRAYLTMPSQEDAFYTRPSIRINVPDHLKNLLVDDWENVTKSLLLVPLPSQAPANYIIDEYFNAEKMNRRLCSPEADILEEFCAGLKMYFEKAVGKILLYRFERSQLAEVRKLWESGRYKEWEGKGPGDCYGAEHLTRMIVNLPEMIAQTNMDAEAVSRLKTELSKFSTWLSRNSAKYFCAKYEKPSAEYIENAR